MSEKIPDNAHSTVAPANLSVSHWRLALLGAVALALIVRLIALGSKSAFADEVASLRFAQMRWASFWDVVTHSEANMALYYVLLRFWVHLSATLPFARLLSVLLAVATVPVVYCLGSTILSRRAGFIACLLLSLNVFHITYSQAARGYSLAVLMAALSALYFVKNVREPGTNSAVGYVAASTAAVYAHFFGFFVLMSQFVSLLALGSPRPILMRRIRLMGATAILGMPLVMFAVVHKTEPLFWVQHPTAKDIYHFFTYLTGSGLKLGLALIALGFAGRDWWGSSSTAGEQSPKRWAYLFLTLWLLLPVLTAVVLSHWKPIFSPRFLMICLPAMTLLVGAGLSAIQWRWMAYLITATLLLSFLTALPSYYRSPGIEDWKSVEAFLGQNAGANDIIVIEPYYANALQYSSTRSGQGLPTQQIVSKLTGFEGQPQHIWIISCHPTHTGQDELPPMPEGFSAGTTSRFSGVEVLQYVSLATH